MYDSLGLKTQSVGPVMKNPTNDLWRRRLYFPCYQIKEAARYTQASTNTISRWHKMAGLEARSKRTELSYLQLIEVAVVARFREANIKLKTIRVAREYLQKKFEFEYPFAKYKFKTDGKELLMDYDQINREIGKDKLLNLNKGGQLEWKEVVDPILKSFEYEDDDGLAVRWHVAGEDSPVVIDPQISFGAPSISGTPTWALGGRWKAGESIEDIAYDFDLEEDQVKEALTFEGLQPDMTRQSLWVAN